MTHDNQTASPLAWLEPLTMREMTCFCFVLVTSRQPQSWLIPFKLSAPPAWLKARVTSFAPVADFESSLSPTSDN